MSRFGVSQDEIRLNHSFLTVDLDPSTAFSDDPRAAACLYHIEIVIICHRFGVTNIEMGHDMCRRGKSQGYRAVVCHLPYHRFRRLVHTITNFPNPLEGLSLMCLVWFFRYRFWRWYQIPYKLRLVVRFLFNLLVLLGFIRRILHIHIFVGRLRDTQCRVKCSISDSIMLV